MRPPGAAAGGGSAPVTVSPTRTSRTSLSAPAMKPTSPVRSSPVSTGRGRKQPTSVTSKVLPVAMSFSFMPFWITPSLTRT